MPVPMPALGSASPLPQQRPLKRGRRRKTATVSSFVDFNSQLLEAIVQGKVQVVRRLLSTDTDPNVCSTMPSEDPALLLACSHRSADTRHTILNLLLAKGASVDAGNRVRLTPLMRSAMEGNADTCELLLAAGAKVGQEDCDGNTALSYAAENGGKATTTTIVLAAKAQRYDIDHRNIKGLTALLIACQKGHLAAARVLVQEGGASPSIRDLDNFMTAAELMQRSGHYLESDLKFLYPVSRKKSYYRQQREEKGIKTLSDYLSPSGNTDSLTNVFICKSSTEKDSGHLPRLPVSPSPAVMTQNTAHSMFDIPSGMSRPPPSPSLRKKSLLPPPHRPHVNPELTFSRDFKSDLYRSRYLKQRQMYVSPNRQSACFHEGALQPLPDDPLERISQAVEKRSREEAARGMRGGGRDKHKSLPPLQRQNSQTM